MTHPSSGLEGKEAWQRLTAGNSRFVQGRLQGRNLPELRGALAQGQRPHAAVLCCSDSRVPPELVFDQSLGDLFVVRTAGLVLDPTSIGSLEYAVDHLGVALLVILGHESCGAVTAAVEHPGAAAGHSGDIVRQIAPAATQARQGGESGPRLVEAATRLHLQSLATRLSRESPVVAAALAAGRLHLVVGKYFLASGQVVPFSSTF
jgi:carbonic anhydrase